MDDLTVDLPAVDLDAVLAQGALLTRTDRKYILSRDALTCLMHRLPGGTAVLQIDGRQIFGYRSVYFDTPVLTSYLQAARRRPRRFKVRTRTYLDSGQSWLEVKVRDGRGRTVKQRTPHGDPDAIDERGAGFVGQVLPDGPCPASLAPELTTSYRRATLYLPAQRVRATVDFGLTAEEPGGRSFTLPDQVIVETKTASAASDIDRVLWRLGHRPAKVSKYGTSMALLHPVLPGNKWRPVIRRLNPQSA